MSSANDTYTSYLLEKYGAMPVFIRKHDTSFGGLPCYVEVSLGFNPKTHKDKGNVVLELGNFLYRHYGLQYQACPEYCGRGKKTTLRWFMNAEQAEGIRRAVCMKNPEDAFMVKHSGLWPFGFYAINILTVLELMRVAKASVAEAV